MLFYLQPQALNLHCPKKLLKIQAAKYAKLKYVASTSTYPYSYCRSRQHEKKHTAKILWWGRGEKTTNKTKFVRASQQNSMRKSHNHHNFIFRSSIQRYIWSFQQNTMPSTIMDQAFYLKTYFLFLNPQW